jgi:hypothetical protein
MWFIWFVIWILGIVLATRIAANRGNSEGWAFFWAFMFGPLGVIIALVLPRNESTLEKAALSSGEHRKCPYCAEIIRSEALVCRYCGRELTLLNVTPPHTDSEFNFNETAREQKTGKYITFKD